MDAVEYLKAELRMCESIGKKDCVGCGFGEYMEEYKNEGCFDILRKSPEEAVKIVEKWNKENPEMTNARKFEEVFGCKLGKNPKRIVAAFDGSFYHPVPDSWWDEPYKEKKE